MLDGEKVEWCFISESWLTQELQRPFPVFFRSTTLYWTQGWGDTKCRAIGRVYSQTFFVSVERWLFLIPLTWEIWSMGQKTGVNSIQVWLLIENVHDQSLVFEWSDVIGPHLIYDGNREKILWENKHLTKDTDFQFCFTDWNSNSWLICLWV
jgi:hypothetical protein